MNKKIIITESSKQTKNLGKKFVKRLHLDQGVALSKNRVVALYGELGSGKTTFVQGLAEGLGIKRRIISPTFIIVRCYELQTQNSKLKTQKYKSKVKSLGFFYHIDLYRIDDEESIKGLGIEEIIKNPENIVAIEWAQNLEDFLPKRRIEIKFSYVDGNKRRIEICPTE